MWLLHIAMPFKIFSQGYIESEEKWIFGYGIQH